MKKLITIALLCAMVLSCFASCGSMQAGELDVEAYAEAGNTTNVSFKTKLDENADVWDGSIDASWYDPANPKSEYEISTGAQLRGIYKLQEGLSNGQAIFENVTIKLTNDIDLDGRVWGGASSQKYFGGTFDGQGHAIGNYKHDLGSGWQGFFGSLQGNACIKNVSIIDASVTFKAADHKESVGGLTGRINTVEGQTVTISNVYMDMTYAATSSKFLYKLGGLVGTIQGDKGNVVIEGCQVDMTASQSGHTLSGVVAYVSNVKNLTVKDTIVNADLTSSGKKYDTTKKATASTAVNIGGIIGHISTVSGDLLVEGCDVSATFNGQNAKTGGIIGYIQTANGKVTVADCTVSGTITGKASAAGIIGATKTLKGDMTIKNCNVSSNITGTTQVGGILGQLSESGSAKNVTVKDCVASGVITGTTMSGGIVGYCDKAASSLTISGCKTTGSFTGQRTSGGIMGTLNIGSSGKAYIENCEVTASLFFDLSDKKNNNAGGLVGKVHSKTYIDNCHVNVVMKATFAPKLSTTATDDLNSGAGGFIGRVYDGVLVEISNSSVAGSYEFIHAGNDLGQKFNAGRFVGNVGTDASARFLENNSIASNLEIISTGVDIVVDGEGTIPQILPVGYQTRDNGDGTYDLRYVFAAKDVFNGLGVKADISYVDGEGVYNEKNLTVYTDTVYTYVMGGEDLYGAEDYGYAYLYTLVVKGVPAEYTVDNENLQVILKTFGATNEAGVVTTTPSGIVAQGKDLSNTAAKDVELTIDDFSATLDDKYVADGAIYIPGESYDAAVSIGVASTAASKNECTGGYKDGTLTIPTHYYLDANMTSAGNDLMNITYNFRVTESGWYDMCMDMRMKGSGDDYNGSNSRELMMLIDGKGGADAYDMHFKLTNVGDIKTESAGTYMTGVKVYLEAGEHTMTFKADASYNGAYMHIRNIFLAKAD